MLNVIEFTSTRKRMSVIVKDPKDRIRLLTKGADTMIFERLGDTPESREYLDSTLDHLEEFAQSGLRTLCLAMRDIGATQYENWDGFNSRFQVSYVSRSCNLTQLLNTQKNGGISS